MSLPYPLQTEFNRMVQDAPRDQLGQDAVWNMVDWIPQELDFPLGKRGGWSYASNALTGVLTGADRVQSIIYAPFNAGSQLVAVVRDDGAPSTKVAQIVSPSSSTDRGATVSPLENLTFYRQKVYITDSSGSTTPQTYDGSSNATNLAGSPPTGKFSGAYKDRLILANTASQLQRIYFSAAGDPTTWDTTNRYIDATGPIQAIYMLRNAILIFQQGFLERIIGSIPPPGTDMFLQPVFSIGTDQPKSLAGTDQFVAFANASGVYLTDGSSVSDMTLQGGMKSLWQSRTASAVTSLSLAGGFYRGYYWVTIQDGNSSFVDAFRVGPLPNGRNWQRFSNLTASSFARRVSGMEELYWGDFSEARVNSTSGFFSPASAIKNDGDGTAVTPVLETPYYKFGYIRFSRTRRPYPVDSTASIKNVYLNYDMRDAASDNPTLQASYVTSPELTSYTNCLNAAGANYPFAETLKITRARRAVAPSGIFGAAFKLAQTNASASTSLFGIYGDTHAREASRVTQ